MGMLKNHQIHIEELAHGVADKVAVEAGARSLCDCGTTRDEGMWADVPEFVAGLYEQNHPLVRDVDREELEEALAWLQENGNAYCDCEMAMERDP